ncbi:hypothetical protein DKX38_015332 [Salix brachista]|uniref:Uncharacterized protein n=1 Tax=Salix brachista TaxID=2182728 RepID=A0A5N5L4Y2_9ROSI|nr:hypothetical protein DKX38_015332 [Salix brachista]
MVMLYKQVVVFDNKSSSVKEDPTVMTDNNLDENESGGAFFTRILRYLETPQYLRKALFPKHNNLRFVGMLPPLDAPHHLRKHEWAPFREGVTLNEKLPNSGETLVDVGLSRSVVVNQALEPGIRVTVAMGTNRNLDGDSPRQVVSLSKPREEAGMYWGYRVRYASNISSVFEDCPYRGGYDHLIGTSEHGLIINSSELSLPTFRYALVLHKILGVTFSEQNFTTVRIWDVDYVFFYLDRVHCLRRIVISVGHILFSSATCWHLLIGFGGLAGLEENIEEDSNLKGKDVREVFDSYLNTCPRQGSRSNFDITSVFPRTNQPCNAKSSALKLPEVSQDFFQALAIVDDYMPSGHCCIVSILPTTWLATAQFSFSRITVVFYGSGCQEDSKAAVEVDFPRLGHNNYHQLNKVFGPVKVSF